MSSVRKLARVPVPGNHYSKVTMPDAIKLGLVDVINAARGTRFTPGQFLADAAPAARDEEIFEQSYMCNPLGASPITLWTQASSNAVVTTTTSSASISNTLKSSNNSASSVPVARIPASTKSRPLFTSVFSNLQTKRQYRLGFEVAASGQATWRHLHRRSQRRRTLAPRSLYLPHWKTGIFLKPSSSIPPSAQVLSKLLATRLASANKSVGSRCSLRKRFHEG